MGSGRRIAKAHAENRRENKKLPIIVMTHRLKKYQSFLFLSAVFFVLSPLAAQARIGVGVGLGKIQIDEPLQAGGIYNLPSLPVINTGDEPGEYGTSVAYLEGAPQLRPAQEWFRFEPQNFYLEPGKVQLVNATLTLPTKVQPGDYFAYLEGRPESKASNGQTAIGVAAAAKIYFTVAPSNIFQASYYRLASLYAQNSPWDTIVLAVLVFSAIVYFAVKFIGKRFNFNITKK
jgi:hypothetical protein